MAQRTLNQNVYNVYDEVSSFPFTLLVDPQKEITDLHKTFREGNETIRLEQVVGHQKTDDTELLTHPDEKIRKLALFRYTQIQKKVLKYDLEQSTIISEESLKLAIMRAHKDVNPHILNLVFELTDKHYGFKVGPTAYYKYFLDFLVDIDKAAKIPLTAFKAAVTKGS